MKVPSVVGRQLGDARRILGETGVVVEVERTSAPGGGPAGPLRVVRQRRSGERVELVAAACVALPGEEDNDG